MQEIEFKEVRRAASNQCAGWIQWVLKYNTVAQRKNYHHCWTLKLIFINKLQIAMNIIIYISLRKKNKNKNEPIKTKVSN